MHDICVHKLWIYENQTSHDFHYQIDEFKIYDARKNEHK